MKVDPVRVDLVRVDHVGVDLAKVDLVCANLANKAGEGDSADMIHVLID